MDANSVRFARQRVLAGFGSSAQERLAAGRVLVIGAGGLGSAALPMLAAAGVGAITIVDDDVVDESNLHRQTLFTMADVGRAKADAAAQALRRLSPEAAITARTARFDQATASILMRDVDLVVDASDTLDTRYLLNDAAAACSVPLVWGNALGWSGQVGVAWSERGADYRDLFPEPAANDGSTCSVVGVLPTVCAVIGSLMANEAIKLLSGSGDALLERVINFDARTTRFREIEYRRGVGSSSRAIEDDSAKPRVLDPFELRALLDNEVDAPVLLDVREAWEAERGRLPGSILIPLSQLTARHGELDPTSSTVVYCQHGVRSAQAADYLGQIGFTDVSHLDGGFEAWAHATEAAAQHR